jgi:general secretion pathway protein K
MTRPTIEPRARSVLRNRRGVAIILVLGAITIMSGLAVDFGFNSEVQLRLALAGRDRLQSEYLARSGVNFLHLLMVKERAFKDKIAQLSQGAIDPKIPICKQFPLSTELLRAIFASGALGGGGSEGEGGEEGEEAAEPATEKMVTSFDVSKAKEFLQFRGDFDGACEDESGKMNLNYFAALKSEEKTIGGPNTYDRFKGTIMQLMLQKDVRKLFGKRPEQRVVELVRNIGDWIDVDTNMNERPGVSGGAERSIYSERGPDFKIRNGKMTTLDELYLVEGVKDSWFGPLRPFFTIYGKEKVNICTSEPVVIEALIMSYAEGNARVPAVNPKNRKLIDSVVDGVSEACGGEKPTPASIAKVVEGLLAGQGAETTAASGAAAAGGTFADLLEITGGPYRLVGTGRVIAGQDREVSARIEMVIDTSDKDPKKWKRLYWNMD